MSRAQLKSSLTDDHARRIARAIAKGKPPPLNADLDEYCESSPHEIFAAFIGAAGGSVAAKSQQSTAEGSSWRRRPCSLQRSRWPARSRAGRLQAAPDEPRVNSELRELILRMSKENPLWGGSRCSSPERFKSP